MRRIARPILTSLLASTLVFAVPIAFAAGDESGTRAPDNTGVNERDEDGLTKTPMDQSNDPADVATTRKIRQEIVDLDSLSMNARNVKVITAAGVVTLRGPVATQSERDAIESIARNTQGVKQVENQIEVEHSTAKED